MRLQHQELVQKLRARTFGALPRAAYSGVTSDDRHLDGDLFVAIQGASYDPYPRLPQLAAEGVRGVVGELPPPAQLDLPYYQVESARRALAIIEQALRGDPAANMRVIGVTGTNGKSTTVRLVSELLKAGGRQAGWVSTVSNGVAGREVPSRLTTPEPRELAEILAAQLAAGAEDSVLEVSSHALAQERVAGIEFGGAVFTNISRDHYDYHGTSAAYLAAKLSLFDRLESGAPAVIPWQGPVPRDPGRWSRARFLTFGEDARADAYPRETVLTPQGMGGTLSILGELIPFQSPLIGRHNLENILASSLLARALDVPAEAITTGLQEASPVPGRLEQVPTERGQVFVDYAHTPDALRAVLSAVREITRSRLVVVFGCGGDRDRGKRPEMGRVVEEYADVVVPTSDNPRSEDPQRILGDILEGLEQPHAARPHVDRREAIAAALEDLQEGDVLVVAGKGHEAEQEIDGERFPFDDREVIREILAKGGTT